MEKIVNLTPHPVVVCGADGAPIMTFKPTGTIARAVQADRLVGDLKVAGVSVPLVVSEYGAPVDLPEAEPETFYIVSVITAQAAKASGRSTGDLLLTADLVRCELGKIIGCRKFATL